MKVRIARKLGEVCQSKIIGVNVMVYPPSFIPATFLKGVSRSMKTIPMLNI
jgi:hypothetical protein